MHEIEARKDGVVYCVYADESCLPNKNIIKDMASAGYKLYQDGRLYKTSTKKAKSN